MRVTGRSAARSLAVLAMTFAVPAWAQSPSDGRAPSPTDARPRSVQAQTARKVQFAQAVRQREALERGRRQADDGRDRQQRESSGWPEVRERVFRTLRLGRNGTFELQNPAGDVVIRGGGGSEIRIEAVKRARHRTSALARGLLPQMRIDIVERGGNVELRTDQPRRRGVWTAVDYMVTVPSGANVVLGVGSGNVRVTDIDGELRADSADGNLIAAGVGRVRHLETMRGTIDVSDAEADELSANTIEGDLILRNLKGRVIDVNSVNGDVRLVDVETSRARLQTMAGDIEYAGPLARSGRYEFATHSGTIRLRPSGSAGFDLEAHSFAGDIRSDYALKAIGDAIRRRSERMLRGTFGDAAAVLTARTFSGDILIVKR